MPRHHPRPHPHPKKQVLGISCLGISPPPSSSGNLGGGGGVGT